MMDKTFIEAIQAGRDTKVVTVNGVEYSTRDVHNAPLPVEPQAETLEVGTLSGLAAYASALDIDRLVPAELILHVVSHEEAVLRSKITGAHRQRCNRQFTLRNLSYGLSFHGNQ